MLLSVCVVGMLAKSDWLLFKRFDITLQSNITVFRRRNNVKRGLVFSFRFRFHVNFIPLFCCTDFKLCFDRNTSIKTKRLPVTDETFILTPTLSGSGRLGYQTKAPQTKAPSVESSQNTQSKAPQSNCTCDLLSLLIHQLLSFSF